MKDIVRTDKGLVKGEVADGIARFLGVPFAKPPVGDLRWRPPEEADAWEGVKECTRYADICTQHSWLDADGFPMSEDCLYLNIWSPAKGADDKLPVVVWIHGGGYTGGTSREELTKGMIPARRGVVVVSVQYRLGVFGFLAHPELSRESGRGVSGNYGTLDQAAAVRWVARNIAAFGGDPDRITLAGQSAGGDSVARLLAMEGVGSLVRGAIIQSGGPHPSRRGMSLAEAVSYGEGFVARAGARDIAQARRIPDRDLLELATAENPGVSGRFRPVTDGVYLKEEPFAAFKDGHIPDIPLVLSCTLDEGRYGAFGAGQDELLQQARQEKNGEEIVRAFGLDGAEWRQGAERLGSLLQVAGHARLAAHMAPARRSGTWIYRFTERLSMPDGSVFKASHSEDLRFTWGRADRAGDLKFVPAQRHFKFAEDCVGYLTDFVKTGDPNGGQRPRWESAGTRGDYLDLNSACPGTRRAGDLPDMALAQGILDGYFE